METERKLDVLADIARALNQSGVTWAVGDVYKRQVFNICAPSP